MKKYLLELIDSDILRLKMSRDAKISLAKLTEPHNLNRAKEYLSDADNLTRRIVRIEKYRAKVAAMVLA